MCAETWFFIEKYSIKNKDIFIDFDRRVYIKPKFEISNEFKRKSSLINPSKILEMNATAPTCVFKHEFSWKITKL